MDSADLRHSPPAPTDSRPCPSLKIARAPQRAPRPMKTATRCTPPPAPPASRHIRQRNHADRRPSAAAPIGRFGRSRRVRESLRHTRPAASQGGLQERSTRSDFINACGEAASDRHPRLVATSLSGQTEQHKPQAATAEPCARRYEPVGAIFAGSGGLTSVPHLARTGSAEAAPTWSRGLLVFRVTPAARRCRTR